MITWIGHEIEIVIKMETETEKIIESFSHLQMMNRLESLFKNGTVR